ncbi:hypothetical protein SAMN04487895_101627 [Paenibacillus sophorae]|uniref:Uncharacterized protein n=1 Tax=Paenibacillus sophorae TaxID=1333845 RepID=A0A1H8GS48_9BACL|nr:hypothetical protein [Paenibacillus sophorae]QWU14324.1 hypothetical protein KP014_20675 [Paenibacillus sophorae]SEN46872.1 hypothetical protein SAMN04487895_101627 [Paenibacillus sophorae]
MAFCLRNLFKKKEKSLVQQNDIVEVTNSIEVKPIEVDGKRFVEVIEKSSEIQRLQKIQQRTKKRRAKQKLQKRIDKIQYQ